MKIGKLKVVPDCYFFCHKQKLLPQQFYDVKLCSCYSWRDLFLPEVYFSFAKFCAFAKIIVLCLQLHSC